VGIEALVQQANLGEISMKHEELNISHEFFFNIYIYMCVNIDVRLGQKRRLFLMRNMMINHGIGYRAIRCRVQVGFPQRNQTTRNSQQILTTLCVEKSSLKFLIGWWFQVFLI
jgi:hypothetical protein